MPSLYVIPERQEPYIMNFKDITPRSTLTLLQELVKGYIEHVSLPREWFNHLDFPDHHQVQLIVNEEGLLLGLIPNHLVPGVVGNVLLVLMDDSNEGDFLDFQESEAKQLLKIIQNNM